MKKLWILLLILITTTIFAVEPKPGVNFKQTKQTITTESGDKIEVVELFWYGCIHCYHMEPYLEKWSKTLPKDVTFKHVPAIPRKNWAPMAKAFYAMETLGVEKKLHKKLFAAIHKEKLLNPSDEKGVVNWIAINAKLDKKEVETAFNSFSMNAKLSRSYKMFKAAGATGVPTIIVDGNYFTSSTMAGGEQNAIDIINYIINNIRNNRVNSKI